MTDRLDRTQHPGKGAELDVVAGLHLAIGKSHDELRRRIDQLEYDLQERYATLEASGKTSTSARTVLPLGEIPAGRVYDLRQLAVSPDPLTTALTVDLYLHVGSPAAGAIAATYRDCVLGSSLPVTATYSRGQFPIRGPDWLYVVLGTTTTATPFQVLAVLGDNPDR